MSEKISIHLPDAQLQQLDEIVKQSKKFKNRTDVIHVAVKKFIENELEELDKIGEMTNV